MGLIGFNISSPMILSIHNWNVCNFGIPYLPRREWLMESLFYSIVPCLKRITPNKRFGELNHNSLLLIKSCLMRLMYT